MMVEMFNSRGGQANSQPALGYSISKAGHGPFQSLSGVMRSGLKTLRVYAVFGLLVLLLPLFLALTRDWICVLVVFQAFAAAVRLQNAPAARDLTSCSSTSVHRAQSKENIVRSNALRTLLEAYDKQRDDCLKLRYLGDTQIAVRGAVTRNLYLFSENQPVQTVDARDAKSMLASRVFGIAS